MIDPSIVEYLAYDPGTGVFTWRRDYYRHKAGAAAGHRKGKYLWLKWKDVSFASHRVAVYLMTGAMPEGVVDHINGDPLDNRWSNLRVTTAAVNAQNRKPMRSISGLTGAIPHRQTGKWSSQIEANGKAFYLGLFATPEEAHAAYAAAKARLHGPHTDRNVRLPE